MTLTPTPPISIVATLVRLIGLELPQTSARRTSLDLHDVIDTVNVSPETPSAAMLWTMAATGLRRLEALLPALQRSIGPASDRPDWNQSVRESVGLEPPGDALGHLAQSVGAAAHQVGTGFGALLTSADRAGRPSETALEGWRSHAASTLDSTSSVLQQAERALTATAAPGPQTWWAMSELVSAQRTVGSVIDRLQAGLTPLSPPPAAIPAHRVAAMLLVLLAATASLLWLGAAGLFIAAMSLALWAVWLRRVALPRSTLRLDLSR